MGSQPHAVTQPEARTGCAHKESGCWAAGHEHRNHGGRVSASGGQSLRAVMELPGHLPQQQGRAP